MFLTDTDIRYYLQTCYWFAASNSEDRSNQNAALILDGKNIAVMAANRLPDGVVRTDERISTRPLKYDFFEHGESGAILAAAKIGFKTLGKTMICPWFACAPCARAIICAGIRTVIGHKQRCDMTNLGREKVADPLNNRWSNQVTSGDQMLREAGIQTIYYDGVIGDVSLLVNEQRVTTL